MPHARTLRVVFRSLYAAFHDSDTRLYRWTQNSIGTLILLSILLIPVELFLPEDSQGSKILQLIDRVVLSIFAVEILLRVITFRPSSLEMFRRPPMGRLRTHLVGRLVYLLRPIMMIDLLAVLALFPEFRGLRALRLLRLLRTTRMFKYHNPFAIVLQATEENGLLFAFAFGLMSMVTLLGGTSIYLVEVNVNPNINTLIDGLWWALVTVTTVGFGDISPVTSLGRIIGAGMMVSGMFSLALFAGIVGTSLVSGVASLREEQFRMSEYANHLVVCGYDESTHLLLEALAHERDLKQTKVVIFDNHERPRELPPEFHWVRGDPTKESELDKVRLSHAAAVIVSGERDTTPQVADARTILIIFTVRGYLSDNRKRVRYRKSPIYVVAEVLDSENVDHALSAGADEVIETRKIGYSMIAHAVGYHGTAKAMSRVLTSGAHNVYIGKIPGKRQEPVRFGDLLTELQLSKRGGLIVGVRDSTGTEVINPSKEYMVEPTAALLYLAETPLLEVP